MSRAGTGMGRGARRPGEPLWTRHYLLAIAVNFCLTAVFYMLMTTTALYAFDRFRASESGAGLAAGSFVVGAVLARLFGGKYLDFVGRRRMLLLGLGVSAAASLGFLGTDSLWLFIAVRMLHGVAFGAASTGVTTGALALIPAARRAEGAGYYGISSTLASAVGPLAGVVLLGWYGYDALFVASTVLSLSGLAIALMLRLPERQPGRSERAQLRSLRFSTLVDTASLPVSSVMLIAGIALAAVLGFLNPYAESEGHEPTGGLFFAVYAGTALLARLFIGRLQDRFGDNAVVYPLLLCLAGGLALLALGPVGATLILAAVLIGLGFGVLMPSVQAIAVGIAPPHRVGLATSTFFLMADLGVGIGPILVGALIPLIGYRGVYLALAGCSLGAVLLYALVHGRRPQSRS